MPEEKVQGRRGVGRWEDREDPTDPAKNPALRKPQEADAHPEELEKQKGLRKR